MSALLPYIGRYRIAWVPVWVITNSFAPFLSEGHPWRGRWLSLRSWCEKGTRAALEYSLFFWFASLTMLGVFFRCWPLAVVFYVLMIWAMLEFDFAI